MKCILITGISGVGKSSVIVELLQLGYKAVDLDQETYSEWVAVTDDSNTPGEPVEPDRDWVWQEGKVRTLLATEDANTLTVSGTAANMGQFLPEFNHVILLSAPADLIAQRLKGRTGNAYGKHPDEVARVLDLKHSVEPLLRKASGHEIVTTTPLQDVVDKVVEIIESDGTQEA